jgi:hypothetical protein
VRLEHRPVLIGVVRQRDREAVVVSDDGPIRSAVR